MLKLNQTGNNWFTITDDGCGQVSGTKEELEELYQQISRIKDGLPQKKESFHTVILEDDYINKEVQMELSDSAYKLLCYLYNEDWLGSDDIHFAELDEKKIERFI